MIYGDGREDAMSIFPVHSIKKKQPFLAMVIEASDVKRRVVVTSNRIEHAIEGMAIEAYF